MFKVCVSMVSLATFINDDKCYYPQWWPIIIKGYQWLFFLNIYMMTIFLLFFFVFIFFFVSHNNNIYKRDVKIKNVIRLSSFFLFLQRHFFGNLNFLSLFFFHLIQINLLFVVANKFFFVFVLVFGSIKNGSICLSENVSHYQHYHRVWFQFIDHRYCHWQQQQ